VTVRVELAHFLGGLFGRSQHHHAVTSLSGSNTHSIEATQPHRPERDWCSVGGVIEKLLARGIEDRAPLF
jgi:hypothetical protein